MKEYLRAEENLRVKGLGAGVSAKTVKVVIDSRCAKQILNLAFIFCPWMLHFNQR